MSASAGWELEERDGILLVRSAALARIPHLAHAFSTRRADFGYDFDLGPADPAPGAPVFERRRRFLAAAGFATGEAAVLRQVHGCRIVPAAGATGAEADGVVWTADAAGAGAATVRSADCVPILLAAEDGRAAAAVHAGWRGTAAQVAMRAVDALAAEGVAPAELTAALGPLIRPCCYPVAAETARLVAASIPGSAAPARPAGAESIALDLHAANRGQLAAAGVPVDRIHAIDLCTACRADLFFSYRREKGASGRMMSAVGPGRP